MSTELATGFKQNIQQIFGENLIAGFIFGSVARGHDKPGSDIDMFVCTRDTPSPDEWLAYSHYYYDLHQQFERCPDNEYPGELETLSQCRTKIIRAAGLPIRRGVYAWTDFDALFITNVLQEKKMAMVIGDEDVFDEIHYDARRVIDSWKKELHYSDCLCSNRREKAFSPRLKNNSIRELTTKKSAATAHIGISQHSHATVIQIESLENSTSAGPSSLVAS